MSEITEARQIVANAVDKTKSKQPRFENNRRVFDLIFSKNYSYLADEMPPQSANNRVRDEWLSQFVKDEPHLISTLQQAVSIDVNRGWEMIGGRNQVSRFTQVMHNYHGAPGLIGWRNGLAMTSTSFYNADINAIVELGRNGKRGPLAGFYHVDPTKCVLTGNVETPLKYYNGKKYDQWTLDDYMRIASMPDITEKLNGLGFCAVSRCINLAITLWAVHRHDQEQLAARAPQGLLLLTGYSEDDWNNAMEAREEDLTSRERAYFGGVAVLATTETDGVDARLVALSQLPANIDRRELIDMTMYGYALAFGYDPSEFWPVQFGSLGRGAEAEMQSEKATQKGGLSFALGFQEQVQKQLPETLLFQFQERDDRGKLLATEVKQAKAEFIATLSELRETSGDPTFTNDELRQLGVDEGIIPSEWTQEEEDVTADDEGEIRQRMLERYEVRNAVDAFPDEEIVRYIWTPDGEKLETLWRRGSDAIKRHSFPVATIRQDEDEILYESPDGEVVITEEDVDRAIEDAFERDDEMGELLTAESVED